MKSRLYNWLFGEDFCLLVEEFVWKTTIHSILTTIVPWLLMFQRPQNKTMWVHGGDWPVTGSRQLSFLPSVSAEGMLCTLPDVQTSNVPTQRDQSQVDTNTHHQQHPYKTIIKLKNLFITTTRYRQLWKVLLFTTSCPSTSSAVFYPMYHTCTRTNTDMWYSTIVYVSICT